MKPAFCAFWLAIGSAAALCQAPPAAAPAPAPDASDPGFQFALPSGWEALPSPSDPAPPSSQAPQNIVPARGTGCIKVPLTAHSGDARSVLIEVVLPFACFGQIITQDQLPDLAAGAAEGLKQAFDISDAVESNYMLGTHRMWAQHAMASPKGADVKSQAKSKGQGKDQQGGQSASPFTFEIACGLLHKSAVCWAVAASDAAALSDFDHASVTLDADPPASLVPATVFPAK
jgi:hypothetical protein